MSQKEGSENHYLGWKNRLTFMFRLKKGQYPGGRRANTSKIGAWKGEGKK